LFSGEPQAARENTSIMARRIADSLDTLEFFINILLVVY
jgi:hypothetical protein